jgi:hypothetical protein
MVDEFGANHIHVLSTKDHKVVQCFLLYTLDETLDKRDRIGERKAVR